MPVAEQPQHLQALSRANEIRLKAARQRRELHHSPPRRLIPALLDPTPELATYKIGVLIGGERGVIPRFSSHRLSRAFGVLRERYPLGREWHAEIRLRDLSRTERERLVRALMEVAPLTWSQAA